MALALGTATVVLLALLFELGRPRIIAAARGVLAAWQERRRAAERARALFVYDPGRERRAEQRARELLRSCVGAEEWEMYRDLGFLRVWGRAGDAYAYLIFPHRPIVAYVPATGELLNEYCVEFPDHTRPYGSPRLPDSDDVLAKWMALVGDERGLISGANMHLPGRQIDPARMRADLRRLSAWERERGIGRDVRPDRAAAGAQMQRGAPPPEGVPAA